MASQSNNNVDMQKRKRAYLNKFLSKTYHIIDQCDSDIATWSDGGDSFTVKDISTFEQEVLPKYFNHSKFSSFIRQLNFYGFQKMRSDPDLQVHTEHVRFSHEYFKKGQPDLLHKIHRTTAGKPSSTGGSAPATNDQVEALQKQVAIMQDQMTTMQREADEKVEAVALSLEKKYTGHMQRMEASYEALFSTLLNQYKRDLQHKQVQPSFLPLLSAKDMPASTSWVNALPLRSSPRGSLTDLLRSAKSI